MKINVLASVCLAFALAACATTETTQPPTPPPSLSARHAVILVSIDGFRPDYMNRGITPALSELAHEGVSAAAMRPSFPSVTFPNHYTLVTGLRPDHNGMVNNYMEDPQIGTKPFTLSDKDVASDPRWWNGGEPLWVTAENSHVRTATMFWPGSEVEIRGRRPSDWAPYDKKVTYDQRVDKVIEWLGRRDETRPGFVTLYFEDVDSQGHAHGPDSAEVNTAIGNADAAIARLLAGLRRLGAEEETDLVIVSDHGMASLSPERTIDFDPYLSSPSDHVAWQSGAFVALDPAGGARQARKLLAHHDHFTCWRKGAMPARFQFGANARIPAVFCLADVGWVFFSSAREAAKANDPAKKGGGEAYRPGTGGTHGYDPDAPEMAAFFVAHGPSFASGVTVPAFDNVDVYPMLARLLRVAPQPNDGNAATLNPILREQSVAARTR
jgi:predicted AlkP superfamily pyrophosphatase or phosphodiesterase